MISFFRNQAFITVDASALKSPFTKASYRGLYSQIKRNNRYSILLLIAFPVLLLLLCYSVVLYIMDGDVSGSYHLFLPAVPWILGGTASWFAIAWLGHARMIRMATGAKPLERKTHKRIYNLLENLCISAGMQMPALYIIHDDSLNAFASGISNRSFAISVSSGLINKLNDDELEAVLAHELSHIRNRDVRLLMVSIIFTGIFSFLAELAIRSLRHTGGRKRNKDGKDPGGFVLFLIIVTSVAYLLSLLLKFGISRQREYLADASAADLTRNPLALASALKKIGNDPLIEAVRSRDLAQLFIENPKDAVSGRGLRNLFATHPPITRRIDLLEQYC